MKPSRRSLVLAALLLAMLLLVMATPSLGDSHVVQFCTGVSLLAVLAPWFVTGRWSSAGSIYLVFYWLFHFGIVAPVAAGFTPKLFNATDRTWAALPKLAEAAVPATLFLVACTAAYVASAGHRTAAPERNVPPEPSQSNPVDGASMIGAFVLTAGLGLWVQIFLGSGVGLGGGYESFLLRTQGTLTPYAYLFISAGMGLVGAARHRGISRLAVALFVAWSLPAFLLGLRGEVLIPLLAFVVARSRSGRLKARGVWVVMAGIGALAAGSLVRVMRIGGAPDLQAINPMNGLVELGYSIRPMIAVQDVNETLGTVFTGIATYVAPVERLVVGRILGLPVPDISTDQNVFNIFVASHFGPIGGSVSAEAYRAGGLIGVCLVALLVGVLLGRLDALSSTVARDAFAGMLAGILLLWVRNDFTPVPLSLTIVAGIVLLARVVPGGRRNSQGDRTIGGAVLSGGRPRVAAHGPDGSH